MLLAKASLIFVVCLVVRNNSCGNSSSSKFFLFKGCVRYIFAGLFFKSKLEHLSNCERCLLFHFKSSFSFQENQMLEFYILKFHDVIKCLSIKQEIHFTG